MNKNYVVAVTQTIIKYYKVEETDFVREEWGEIDELSECEVACVICEVGDEQVDDEWVCDGIDIEVTEV